VDMEKVRALKPDLIIGNKEENDRKDIQALEQEFPVWMSDVRDLHGALDMIAAIGEITGTNDKANAIRIGITQAFGALKPLEEPRTVAYFIWREPYMVAGHGTFVNDMLLRLGLINVFDEGDARYPEITAKEVEDASPEVILLSSEPYPFQQKHIEELKEICPDARVLLVDGAFYSWYGSRLLKAPAYFTGLSLV
jgi:ABC-type Fe3+-hydroxamate transport system substrate-binding protein